MANKAAKKVETPDGTLKTIKTLGADPIMGKGLRTEKGYYVEMDGKKSYMIESKFREKYTFA